MLSLIFPTGQTMAVCKDRDLHISQKESCSTSIWFVCHPRVESGSFQLSQLLQFLWYVKKRLWTHRDTHMWIFQWTSCFTTPSWLHCYSGWSWHLAHQTFSLSFSALTCGFAQTAFGIAGYSQSETIAFLCFLHGKQLDRQTPDSYFYWNETRLKSFWKPLRVVTVHLLPLYNDSFSSVEASDLCQGQQTQ